MLPFELPEQTPEQTIPAQLALCGFSPSDVGTLVMSHLHFDHVGGNRHLPDARVLIHAREIAQGRACEPFEPAIKKAKRSGWLNKIVDAFTKPTTRKH